MSAPLIASTNLADLSPAALAIYENEDVIAVDQDPLGRQGVPISSAGGLWVLTKQLSGGERSVLLFNSTNTAATITTSARAAGLRRAPGYSLFNLWSDAVSETGGQISAFVPAHGVAMFRVAPQSRRDLAPLAPHTVLSLAAADPQIQAGATTSVRETFANQGTVSVKRLTLSLFAPSRLAGQAARPGSPCPPGCRAPVHGRLPAHRTRDRAAARAGDAGGGGNL